MEIVSPKERTWKETKIIQLFYFQTTESGGLESDVYAFPPSLWVLMPEVLVGMWVCGVVSGQGG